MVSCSGHHERATVVRVDSMAHPVPSAPGRRT
ncbi:MAG: DNA mismatch repair protein MutT, partial [Arthrobacter sp.]|nr:DNA mismatch repair protein MutT [Arthrobacter sp.]